MNAISPTQRTLLLDASDLHGGHRYGLLNPETVLEEVNENGTLIETFHPKLNRIQEYLFEQVQAWLEEVRSYANGDDIIVTFGGDLTAGNKHIQLLVSNKIADQVLIGVANAAPFYALNPKAVRLVKGTGAHNFLFGSSEILIAQLLKAQYPQISTKIYDHGLFDIDGATVDISHHGPPPGSRNWLRGNELRYYLRSLMMDEFMAGRTPPRLVLRGHYHQYWQETVSLPFQGEWYTSTIVLCPSLTFLDDHSRQVGRSPSAVTHGMILSEFVGGNLVNVKPLIKTIDIRSKETL